MDDCSCLSGRMHYSEYDRTELGTDGRHADVTAHRCKKCGRIWLNYYLEEEAFAGSGRWYRGLIPPGTAVTAENAAALFGQIDGYFAGGSHFGGEIRRRSGPLGPGD